MLLNAPVSLTTVKLHANFHRFCKRCHNMKYHRLQLVHKAMIESKLSRDVAQNIVCT